MVPQKNTQQARSHPRVESTHRIPPPEMAAETAHNTWWLVISAGILWDDPVGEGDSTPLFLLLAFSDSFWRKSGRDGFSSFWASGNSKECRTCLQPRRFNIEWMSVPKLEPHPFSSVFSHSFFYFGRLLLRSYPPWNEHSPWKSKVRWISLLGWPMFKGYVSFRWYNGVPCYGLRL